MAPLSRDPGATVNVTPSTLPPPPPPPPPPAPAHSPLGELGTILELNSLNAQAGQPARLANLSQANVLANTNRGAQNAVANQQAHAQLALSVLGKTVNRVQNLGPLEGRSSTDVLTDNATADAIASLRGVLQAFSGGGSGPAPIPPANLPALIRRLRQLLREIVDVVTHNGRLSGTGTLDDPYVIAQGPLYVAAGITLGFPGVATVDFQIDRQRLRVVGN